MVDGSYIRIRRVDGILRVRRAGVSLRQKGRVESKRPREGVVTARILVDEWGHDGGMS